MGMQIIPLMRESLIEDALAIRSFMLFPEDGKARVDFFKYILVLEHFKYLMDSHEDDDTITIKRRLLVQLDEALDYYTTNIEEIKRLEMVGKRAASIAMILVNNSYYYKQTGLSKQPSLTEAYDILIGFAAEQEKHHGIKIGNNRKSVIHAWKTYGPVSHLWLADDITQSLVNKDKISGEYTADAIGKRISYFLAYAKHALQTLITIIPHSRSEPVVNPDMMVWIPQEFDRDIPDISDYDLIGQINESTIAGIKELLKKYKGARAVGKKKMRDNIEPLKNR